MVLHALKDFWRNMMNSLVELVRIPDTIEEILNFSTLTDTLIQ